MESLKVIDTKNLHHAYLIEDEAETFMHLQDLLRGAHKDAEIHVREFESFGIDDSRELIHMAGMRSYGSQMFIYRARSCTGEAQNALLKLFEEPPEHTHFFVCLSGVRNTLPTLRSRVWLVEPEGGGFDDLGRKFLKASAGERIHILEPIIKEKDITAAEKLLSDVERELHGGKDMVSSAKALKHIINVRRVLLDKGASLKILLESVALTAPRVY